jgi:hypothetical protein
MGSLMTRPGLFEPRDVQRALAGFVSAALHAGVFFAVITSGDRHDGVYTGETPTTQLILMEAPEADEREGVELTPLEPTAATPQIEQPLLAQLDLPEAAAADAPANKPIAADSTRLDEDPFNGAEPSQVVHIPATLPIPLVEKAALSERLAELAAQAATPSPTTIEWEQDGKQYSAVLILQRANDGTALDRVLAEVSASERGKQFSTRVFLKRLPFSQFTHMVDEWDPMVQFHDDEIIGRVHSNSPFNLMYDSRTAPKFLGKVTTAARTFRTDSTGGRRGEADIFKGGIQTRAARIPLPEALEPFEWAPRDENARIHEFANDTHLKFFADGSYMRLTLGMPAAEHVNEPSDSPLYLIAGDGVTLSVEGVVAGKVLIYSPHRIVIEGSLTYAHDPRDTAESPDYLGLVCDKYITIASPGVTGPGDLEIDAAIFAGRRFVVSNINFRRIARRSATLRIYGSLSAGSMSASEPRYAMRLEYDSRFENRRPPGFPSTNRFEVDQWNGKWTEVERTAAETY